MVNSIKYFNTKGIKKIEELEDTFFENPKDFDKYVINLHQEMIKIALMMVEESVQEMSRIIKTSSLRKEFWTVDKCSKKTLTTSIGDIHYDKDLYKNKETGERMYLLDAIMGFEAHERISTDAVARMLNEAVQTSYRRGGEVNQYSIRGQQTDSYEQAAQFVNFLIGWLPQ